MKKRFAGKRVAILNVEVANRREWADAMEIDGRVVVGADSFEELRDQLMADPQVRDSLPFMALMPEKGDD